MAHPDYVKRFAAYIKRAWRAGKPVCVEIDANEGWNERYFGPPDGWDCATPAGKVQD